MQQIIVGSKCLNLDMKQAVVETENRILCACDSDDSAFLLRLLASTSTPESFCIGVEALMLQLDVKSNCSINELPSLQSLEAKIFQIFADKSIVSSSSNAIVSDLLLSKVSFIGNTKFIENDIRNCECILMGPNLRAFIPAPHLEKSFRYMEIYVSEAAKPIYLPKAFFEGLQWALMLHKELSSSRSKDRLSTAGQMAPLSSQFSNSLFTKRQLQIIDFVREDFSNSDIGMQLHISTSLVKLELGKIFKILGISNRKELFDPPRL